MASAKVSRSQPLATVIGSRKRPKTERTPKPTMAIRQPAKITRSGVRQPGAAGREVWPVIGSFLRSRPAFAHDRIMARRAPHSGKIRQVVVPKASRRPSPSVMRPSATPTRRPDCTIVPSASTGPVLSVMPRTRLILNSRVV